MRSHLAVLLVFACLGCQKGAAGGDRPKADEAVVETPRGGQGDVGSPKPSEPTGAAPALPPAADGAQICSSEGLGAVLRLACSGGGRQLVNAFAERAERALPAPDHRRLVEIAKTLPDARSSEAFQAAAVSTYRNLLEQHVTRMYADPAKGEALGAKWSRWEDFSRQGLGKLWSEMRMDEGMHFNALNGLLSFQVTMTSLSGTDESYVQTMQDFPDMGREEIDAGRARTLGDALGQVAFGMKSTRYDAPEVAAVMLGLSAD
jgi:hypothetical protein